MSEPSFVSSVLHPTDFSAASETAFLHSLAIALRRRARITLLHVAPPARAAEAFNSFPGVRSTLERWGLLEPGSDRSAVFDEFGVEVKKVKVRPGDVVTNIDGYLARHPTDMVVLATEGRDGPPRWLRPSVAERVARRSGVMTLFVPDGSKGFVAPEDGKVRLSRILVPLDHLPDPGSAVVFAGRIGSVGEVSPVEIDLLHIGETGHRPRIDLPKSSNCLYRWSVRSGPVVEQIAETAAELEADLVVMATKGHEGFMDALRGSTTEQVLRRISCPLLAVPAS
jgi:nucleotide-binding universal stress UspA family protein